MARQLRKFFKDAHSGSVEPAVFLGTWTDGSLAYESASIYFTHMVRLEKGRSVSFVYDPGRVARARCIPDYFTISNAGALPEAHEQELSSQVPGR